MTHTQKRIRFIQMVATLTQRAALEGIEFIIWTFYRSHTEQNLLYQRGRTEEGKIITNCDGYVKQSMHQKWLAIDALVIKDGVAVWDHTPEYDRLGEIWEALGGKWGGRFKSPSGDVYHFEYGGE